MYIYPSEMFFCIGLPVMAFLFFTGRMFFPEIFGKKKKGMAHKMSKKAGRPIIVTLVAGLPLLFLLLNLAYALSNEFLGLFLGGVAIFVLTARYLLNSTMLILVIATMFYFGVTWLYDNYQEHQIKIQQELLRKPESEE